LGRFQMNRCIVARDLALWHAMAPTMAPTKASHGMPWQPHGTQQGKPWHPARQAMACLGSPMAPTGACHDTHQGMPWHPPRRFVPRIHQKNPFFTSKMEFKVLIKCFASFLTPPWRKFNLYTHEWLTIWVVITRV
jgi:hypothetical protein